VILESSPVLREQSFTIETRKRVAVGGVHHEIDIVVTATLAKGYTSLFIFECKNWEAAVGKNEIIVFSEKIDAVSAQRGYFVAKSFTKDAEAQALKDPRITLLTATEHNPAAILTTDCFEFTAPASVKGSSKFRVTGSSGKHMYSIQIQGTKFRLGGTERLLKEYMDSWMQELYAERLLGFSTSTLPEGVHPMAASAERSFGAGEFLINDKEIEHVQIEAEFGVQIFRPAVIADYEVATRGRAIRLAQVRGHNFAIDTTLVKVLSE